MTTSFPWLRLGQLPVLAALTLLASCGGSSSEGEDFGKALGEGLANGLTCALSNCQPSTEAAVQDVQLSYTATHTGNQLTVTAQLHHASKWARLQLANGDSLSAEVRGRQLELKGSGPSAIDYTAVFDVPGDQPLVKVSFHRGGQTYSSTVTIPQRFALLSPGASAQLNNSSADLEVLIQLPGTIKPTLSSVSTCNHENATVSAFDAVPPFELIETSASQQRYRLKPTELGRLVEKALGASASKPKTCEFKLAWALTQTGSTPAGLSSRGTRVGESAVKLTLSYDVTR